MTASSGTLSSVNLATDRRIGRPLAIEKEAQADVAAGRVARINAETFMVDGFSKSKYNNDTEVSIKKQIGFLFDG